MVTKNNGIRGKKYSYDAEMELKITSVGEPPCKCSLPRELHVLVLLEGAEMMHCPGQTSVRLTSKVKVP